jgi:hypothetical protein
MPMVTKDQAVERISTEIEQFSRDDLVEVHNELFPTRHNRWTVERSTAKNSLRES